ncbi:MAG: ABC transporter substrate-binding protein [Actinomycetaceae bacterium]
MRTRSTTTALALAAVVVLAACSDGDEDAGTGGSVVEQGAESGTGEAAPVADGGSDPATGLVPAGEGVTEYPLALESAYGETTLPSRPERIAVVSPTGIDVEILATLGVTPVLASDVIERAAWTLDALPGEIETTFPADYTGAVPWETVAAADPDLIVVFGKDMDAEWDQAAAIAPVLTVSESDDDEVMDWRAQAESIGEAIDLPGAAAGAIDDYDAFFADLREDHPEFEGLTVSYLVQYSEEWGTSFSNTTGSDTERLLVDLGFAPHPNADDFAADDLVSAELVGQVDADVVIVGDTTGVPGEADRLLLETELFQGLGAVQDGNLVVITNNAEGTGYVLDGVDHPGNLSWALGTGGPLGMQFAAEAIVPMLAEVLG